MQSLLTESKEIMDNAIRIYQPKAIVMMMSGGDDSMTAYSVAKKLGYKFDAIIHGNTRTGIEETTEFVRKVAAQNKEFYIEADAGDAYKKYVLRKGFFGKGIDAHTYAYHILKIGHFRKAVSKHLRKRQRNFPILFVNGARRLESENRKKTMINPYKIDPSQKNNIWINIINEWTKHNCVDFLEGESVTRNPVSINLCRSGECMCGTMQTEGDYNEAKFFYPKWGAKMDALRKEVTKKFPWDWGQNINKYHHMEMKGQTNMFQPMCTGCKVNYEKSEESLIFN